jgi:hypothetical protein
MMAAGCIPVDLYRYNNLLDHHSDCAILAYQSATSLSAALEAVLLNQEETVRRSEACVEFAATRTEAWETDVHCNHVLAMLAGEEAKFRNVNFDTFYEGPPVIAREDDSYPVHHFCDWHYKLAAASLPASRV